MKTNEKTVQVHIGGTLKKLLKAKRIKAAYLAEELGMSERAVHSMYRKKYLHAGLMVRISEVLDHDLFRYLYIPEDLPVYPTAQKQIDELKEEVAQLKQENKMLNRMVKLVEKN